MLSFWLSLSAFLLQANSHSEKNGMDKQKCHQWFTSLKKPQICLMTFLDKARNNFLAIFHAIGRKPTSFSYFQQWSRPIWLWEKFLRDRNMIFCIEICSEKIYVSSQRLWYHEEYVYMLPTNSMFIYKAGHHLYVYSMLCSR